MSEENHKIIIVSTFHVPVGFFQEYWDEAESKNFKRYKWDCYDCMKRCTHGMPEYITKDDPLALKYCRSKCPLTKEVNEYDENGNVIGTRFDGCDGKARKSHGWNSRVSVIKSKQLFSEDMFRVEFECKRPLFSGPIFGRENIERSIVEDAEISLNTPNIIGIDWGYSTEGAMVLLKHCGDCITVVDAKFLSHQRVAEWVDILNDWRKFGTDFYLYADASHPFENREIEDAGFKNLTYVHFHAKVRAYTEYNLSKYFTFGKIKIHKRLERLIDQLYRYRKNDLGQIIKEDDHGPDALEAGMVHWDFMDNFGMELKASLKNIYNAEPDEDVWESEVF